jgi:EAL domain-containing protein (putative c-di-GMP-specific phosphodiesterase class I)
VSSQKAIETLLAPGALSVAFQPIVETRREGRRLLALEALVRGPQGTNVAAAPILFEYMRRKREEVAIDRACVVAVLAAAQRLDPSVALSLNVHSATLSRDPEFLTFLADAADARAVRLDRLTLEIAHHAPLWEGESFRSTLEALRHTGVQIALDDIGLGQANYQMILDCKPDLFKVDGYFVQGCAGDFHRQAILESIQGLASKFGARVVAEAVETEPDRAVLERLGVELFQGFLFARPQSAEALAAGGLPSSLEAG